MNENQMPCLEKEYRLVTSLGYHPRIIQFFAIVPDNRNYQIMIVREYSYMECGSFADKLREQKPLPDNSVFEISHTNTGGSKFSPPGKIDHSDIKHANILYTAEDYLKISDFEIAVGRQLQTKSSATSSHFVGDFHYMSSERLQGADRSAANDMYEYMERWRHSCAHDIRTAIKPSRDCHTVVNEYYISSVITTIASYIASPEHYKPSGGRRFE